MNTNQRFLEAITSSFNKFLSVGTSRSTAKLHPLHGFIAEELSQRLGPAYEIQSQGFGNGKEATMQGRYVDKKVDITILRNQKPIAGIAVKFVMQNYSQNSNNYFENMLGETANIRCNRFPYFQVFIIFDHLPYYNRQKEITKWETLSKHHIDKYVALSADNIEVSMHTPNKTLFYIIHLPINNGLKTHEDYISYYRSYGQHLTVNNSLPIQFSSAVILNDMDLFLQKIYHTVMSL